MLDPLSITDADRLLAMLEQPDPADRPLDPAELRREILSTVRGQDAIVDDVVRLLRQQKAKVTRDRLTDLAVRHHRGDPEVLGEQVERAAVVANVHHHVGVLLSQSSGPENEKPTACDLARGGSACKPWILRP